MVQELGAAPQPLDTKRFVLTEAGIEWESFEKDCLRQALDRFEGNRTKAAKCLGLSYKAFLYRLEKYQLV